MSAKTSASTLSIASLALALFVNQAAAQEVSASHMAEAKKALTATEATVDFDGILPNAALALKRTLNNQRPDKTDQIDVIVDEEALALAPRRGDLENEAGKLFAAAFTEDELKAISAFFSSETGKKYLNQTPFLARELSKAARIWGNGITRDLGTNSAKRLAEQDQ